MILKLLLSHTSGIVRWAWLSRSCVLTMLTVGWHSAPSPSTSPIYLATACEALLAMIYLGLLHLWIETGSPPPAGASNAAPQVLVFC